MLAGGHNRPFDFGCRMFWQRLLVFTTLSMALSVEAMAQAPSGDPAVVDASAKVEELWNDGEFTEGVAVAKDGKVYFSDIAMSGKTPGRILKFDPATGKTTVHVANSGQSNGLFFTADGRLLAACGANIGHRALCEVLADGTMKKLTEKFDGKIYNAPNDLVVHPKGWVYFSDPRYVGKEPLELDHQSVYLYMQDGTVRRATTDIQKPNGVTLSPDAKTLYVAETDNGATGVEPPGTAPKPSKFTLNAFPIQADGTLGAKKVLADFGGELGIDGMTTDTEGRIYTAFRRESHKGIAIFNPAGKEIAFIPTPELPTNCKFGTGVDAKTLYMTVGTGLYRIKLKTNGYHPELAQ